MAYPTYHPNPEEGLAEVSGDGGSTWKPLRGIASFAASGGDKTENTTEYVDSKSESTTSGALPKDVSVEVQPSHGAEAYQMILNDGYHGNKELIVRYSSKEKIVAQGSANNEVAMDAAGTTLTFSGSAKIDPREALKVGQIVKIKSGASTLWFVLDRNESTDDWTASTAKGHLLKGTAASVSATDEWAASEYALRHTYRVNVVSAGNVNLSPGQPYADSLNLKQTSAVAAQSIEAADL